MLRALPGFADRLRLFERVHTQKISVCALAEWALSIGWNIPIQLAKVAGHCVTLPEVSADARLDGLLHKALSDCVAPNVSPEELRAAIEALGHRFEMHADGAVIRVAEGTVQGRVEPLSYGAVRGLHSGPGADVLGDLIRGSGSSGGGASGNSSPASLRLAQTTIGVSPAEEARLRASSVPIPTTSGRQHYIGRDVLHPVVQRARAVVVDSNDSAQVWAELERLARLSDSQRPAPLAGVTSGGLQWRDGGRTKVLTRKALGDRLRRARRSARKRVQPR